MTKIPNPDNTNCWLVCGAIIMLIHYWWEYKTVQTLRKTVQYFPTKFNTVLWPSNCMPMYLPKLHENLFLPKKSLKTCTQMFISDIFKPVKYWKQLKFSLATNWIAKLLYIHTIQYYSVVKNELSSTKRRMNLKYILFSERSQYE